MIGWLLVSVLAAPNSGAWSHAGAQAQTEVLPSAPTWQAHRLLSIHTDDVTGLFVTPDGKQLISCGADGLVAVTELPSLELRTEFWMEEFSFNSVSLSPDATKLVASLADGCVNTWNLEENDPGSLACWPGAEGLLVSWSQALRGRCAMTMPMLSEESEELQTLLWFDEADGWELQQTFDGWAETAWLPNGSDLAIGFETGQVQILDAESGTQTALQTKTDMGIAFLTAGSAPEEGALLAAASFAGDLLVWRLNDTNQLANSGSGSSVTFPFDELGIMAVALSPDGKLIATATDFGVIRLWSLADQQLLANLTGHLSPVLDLKFSADGQWLFSAGSDDALGVFGIAASTRMLPNVVPETERVALRGTDLVLDLPLGMSSDTTDEDWESDGFEMWSDDYGSLFFSSMLYEYESMTLKGLIKEVAGYGLVSKLHSASQLQVAGHPTLFIDYEETEVYGDEDDQWEETTRTRLWQVDLGNGQHLYWQMTADEPLWPWVEARVGNLVPVTKD